MQIGEVARRTGVSIRMIRYFEGEGLLQPARSASGYRKFGEAEVGAVNRIVALQGAGLKLGTIRQLLPCLEEGGGFVPCARVLATLRQELAELDARLATLGATRELLARQLTQAEGKAGA